MHGLVMNPRAIALQPWQDYVVIKYQLWYAT